MQQAEPQETPPKLPWVDIPLQGTQSNPRQKHSLRRGNDSRRTVQAEEDARQREKLSPWPQMLHMNRPSGKNTPVAIGVLGQNFEDDDWGLNIEDFFQRAYRAAEQDLLIPVQDLYGTKVIDVEINLATVQRLIMYGLQRDLLKFVKQTVKAESFGGSKDIDEVDILHLKRSMRDYCQAIRDWELIQQSASTVDRDPFRISTTNVLSRALMEEEGLLKQDLMRHKLNGRLFELQPPRLEQLPGESRSARNKTVRQVLLFNRFIGLFVGSLFLLGPVLVMALIPTLLANLLVTCISTVVFAFVLSGVPAKYIPGLAFIEFELKDALAATLAYAAVLVVFLGTATGKSVS